MKLIVLLLLITSSYAEAKGKVKIKYKEHTSIDFAGNKVEGKIRAPAVFYIFQRKRSLGHQVIGPPKHFKWHKIENKETLGKLLKK